MIRLLGIDLPKNKRIEYALTYIHGIGLTSAKKIIQLAEINPETRTTDITTEQSVMLRNILENFELKLEGDLRRFNGLNIKRLNEINCHRGKRHKSPSNFNSKFSKIFLNTTDCSVVISLVLVSELISAN